jgi:hypothetical protein
MISNAASITHAQPVRSMSNHQVELVSQADSSGFIGGYVSDLSTEELPMNVTSADNVPATNHESRSVKKTIRLLSLLFFFIHYFYRTETQSIIE